MAESEQGEDQDKKCGLCSLPAGRAQVTDLVNGEKLYFCCTGCLYVFRILFNSPEGPPQDYRKTELYRACVAAGLIARGQNDAQAVQDQETCLTSSDPLPTQNFDEELAQEFILKIESMWCIACSWLIEEALRSISGVLSAQVLFLSDLAKVRYLPHRVAREDILFRISALGYPASLFVAQPEASQRKKDLLLRLGVASILTMNVMIISLGLYAGFFEDLGQEGVRYFSYPLWVLATPVVFYGGFPIFRRAWLGLRFAVTSMDTLVTVGVLSAYFYSVIRMASGSLHLYFDTATMLVTLVLLGMYIETQAREKVTRGIHELYELVGSKVRSLKNGAERWVASEAVQPGDEFLVLEGERIPVDGRIFSGRASLDESVLTGESRPVRKKVGDEACGGSLILDGALHLRATATGAQSSISQMVGLMQEALTRKNPVELLADRITRYLVPGVLILAALTALYLMCLRSVSIDEALLRALTVLMITCPCALGIATPLAKVASLSVGRARGLLVRDPEALEKAGDLGVILFDKTGTLTEGNFSLREIVTGEKVDAKDALERVAAVEVHSDHFLAREIMRKAAPKAEISRALEYESYEGLGVKGVVGGTEVAVGNRAFMHLRGPDVCASLERQAGPWESAGATVAFFAWESRVQGFLVFGDRIRESAGGAISGLHKRGIATWLVSGDSEATTRATARELGIANFVGQSLPGDKLQLVRKLQGEGHRVGMVGDGINDAAALAQADVGFAFGAGGAIIRKASDISILSDDPARVLDFLDLSALTTGIIRQNLFFAFFYNLLGIPLAILGLLNPMAAVVAMFASSLTVIGNTLRIAKQERVQRASSGS